MLKTTAGRLLVNETLPEELRDYGRVLDTKGLNDLLRTIADKYPDKYKDVVKNLSDLGRGEATFSGGNSFSLSHMRKSKASAALHAKLAAKISHAMNADDLTDQQRTDIISRAVGGDVQMKHMNEIYQEALDSGNPLGQQVLSGSRGKAMNLASLLGGDMLYADHNDRIVPVPITNSYAQGLTPMQYWAGTYGARKGVIATKMAVQDAGFFGKQLNQLAHRLIVTGTDAEDEFDDDGNKVVHPMRGMPVDVDDIDNTGALLAQDVGPYKRNTVISPKIARHLQQLGNKRILIRSPISGGSPDGGVYSRDLGIREHGGLPGRGTFVGNTAAQSLSEPVSQGTLSSKHSGGVAGQEKSVGGFKNINALIQVPKSFRGGAAHSEEDGVVQRVVPAPAGGHHVYINGKEHYVPQGAEVRVKPGETIEAGDIMSDGLPNPAMIVKHKGIGEGRRYFTHAMRKSMRDSDIKVDRRNVEVIARGLIDHVQLTDEWDDNGPDDVIPYSTLESRYRPREDHQTLVPSRAKNMYLERPVLHYSIGTKVRPSVIKDLEEFGIKDVPVHHEPPPFQPHMVRAMSNLKYDPDPFTRMYGSGLKDSLLDAVHKGLVSDEAGTSFVPSLMRSVDFGRSGGPIRQPEPVIRPPAEGFAFQDEPKSILTKMPMPQRAPVPPPPAPPTPVSTPKPVNAVADEPEVPAEKPKTTSWISSMFKKSGSGYRVKAADAQRPEQGNANGLGVSPAQGSGSQSIGGGQKKIQLTPGNAASSGFSGPGATTQDVQAKLQQTQGANPNAFGGGYSGTQNIFSTGNQNQLLGAQNFNEATSILDPEAMMTLTGQKPMLAAGAGAHQQPGMFHPGMQQPQQRPTRRNPLDNGYGLGEEPLPPPIERPKPNLIQNAPAPKSYAVPGAAQQANWNPGNADFDAVKQQIAEAKGVPVEQVNVADVQTEMYNRTRKSIAISKAGFSPGNDRFEAIRKQVYDEQIAKYHGDGLQAYRDSINDSVEEMTAGGVIGAEVNEAKEQIKFLDDLIKNGVKGIPDDAVMEFLTNSDKIDLKGVNDFEVVDSIRQAGKSTAQNVGEAIVSPTGSAGTVLTLGVAGKAWRNSVGKFVQIPVHKIPIVKKFITQGGTQAASKLLGRSVAKKLPAVGMAYDFYQALQKNPEELVDRLDAKMQGKINSTMAGYLLDNAMNPGDNTVGAYYAGKEGINSIINETGREKNLFRQEAAMLVRKNKQLGATPQSQDRNESAIRANSKRIELLKQQMKPTNYGGDGGSEYYDGDEDLAEEVTRQEERERAMGEADANSKAFGDIHRMERQFRNDDEAWAKASPEERAKLSVPGSDFKDAWKDLRKANVFSEHLTGGRRAVEAGKTPDAMQATALNVEFARTIADIRTAMVSQDPEQADKTLKAMRAYIDENKNSMNFGHRQALETSLEELNDAKVKWQKRKALDVSQSPLPIPK